MKKAFILLALLATLGMAAGCDEISIVSGGWGFPSYSDWYYEPAYVYDTYYVEEYYYDDCCYDDYFWWP